MNTSVTLTDQELVSIRVTPRTDPDLLEEIVRAEQRLEIGRQHFSHLKGSALELVVRIVDAAELEGRVSFVSEGLSYCRYCNQSPGYAVYKSGRKRGQPNYNRPKRLPGYSFVWTFVQFKGNPKLGACRACFDPVRDEVLNVLKGMRVELPEKLTNEPPKWKRVENRRCTSCGWEGHGGQMGRLATLVGDGSYPGVCPRCKARNEIFGRSIIERSSGFAVVPV